MKIYISGPMSGYPQNNAEKFFEAEHRLRKQYPDAEFVNPIRELLSENASWEDYMTHDLKLMLDCDAIAMIPGWETSRGSIIEHRLANDLDFIILYNWWDDSSERQ